MFVVLVSASPHHDPNTKHCLNGADGMYYVQINNQFLLSTKLFLIRQTGDDCDGGVNVLPPGRVVRHQDQVLAGDSLLVTIKPMYMYNMPNMKCGHEEQENISQSNAVVFFVSADLIMLGKCM